MPSVKDESEPEGEEMSHDSNDSNQSSASCDSSAEHSDSDDSSEMDEEECERRRNECIENLVDLERQFTLLKEQLYRERITQVDTKLGEVRLGKSEEYLIPLERLKENMKTKTEVAGILRQYRLQNIQNKFLAEEQAALQNFESEKELIWDSIHNDLQDKIRRLEEDRNNVDFHADLWLNSTGRRRRNHTERRKAVSVAGPYIVYMLNDADILDDWALIKKSLKNEQISAFAVYTKKRKNSATSLQLQKYQKKRSVMGKKKSKKTGNITKKKISSNPGTVNKKQKKPKDFSPCRSGDHFSSRSSDHFSSITGDHFQCIDTNMKMSVHNLKNNKSKDKKKIFFDSSFFFNNSEPTITTTNTNTTTTTTTKNNTSPINPSDKDDNKSKKKTDKKSKKQNNNNKSNVTENQSTNYAKTHNAFMKDPILQSYMLFEWLIYPLPMEKFLHEHWEKRPTFIKRDDADYYKILMSTPIIDKILRDNCILFSKNIDITSYDEDIRENHNPDGRAFPTIVWDYYRNGCSVRMLNPQTYLPRIHLLNATLQELFGCFVGANSYLTPPGSQGFAPHYDDIEAFILQIEGKKRWRLYQPKDTKDRLPRYSSKDLKDSDIGDPFFDDVLEAGDMLYIPRGTIHQGLTSIDSHSLHLTLSVYQKNAWCDLLEKLIPDALEKAITNDSVYREGLPIDFWRHFGYVHPKNTSDNFREFIEYTVKYLVDNIKDYLDIDKAVDEIVKSHMHDFLPPFPLNSEQKCTSICDGEKMIEEGVVKYYTKLEPSTKIRLIRSHCVRLVKEEDDLFRLYHSCANSKEYHENPLQYLEVSEVFVPAIKELISKYPEFIKIEDLPIEDEDNQCQVAKDLWERGIIMTESPVGCL
ncbi:hypothetical protein M0802_001949 [Mischocyttarus mexicanus]|nr:hypothetical protein M0802_001949 [Mischocyttarus mexicanus]